MNEITCSFSADFQKRSVWPTTMVIQTNQWLTELNLTVYLEICIVNSSKFYATSPEFQDDEEVLVWFIDGIGARGTPLCHGARQAPLTDQG